MHPVPRLIIVVTFTRSKGDNDSAMQTSLLLAAVIYHVCDVSPCLMRAREQKDAIEGVRLDVYINICYILCKNTRALKKNVNPS